LKLEVTVLLNVKFTPHWYWFNQYEHHYQTSVSLSLHQSYHSKYEYQFSGV